jgi:hypothetical protein
MVTLPLGIWLIVAVRRATVGLGDEGLAVKWFLTRAYRWADIESVRLGTMNAGATGSLVGDLAGAAIIGAVESGTAGLKGPLFLKLRGRRAERPIAAQSIERSGEMAAELERRSGLKILAS